MKVLKQRFTQWFNKRYGRSGTLWEGRFKCSLIEPGQAARTVAAYIDLNPVRAGIVSDPKDYRWCGYAEAVAGDEKARESLVQVMRDDTETPPEVIDTSASGKITGKEGRALAKQQRRMEHGARYENVTDWRGASRQYRMLLAEDGEAWDQEVTPDIGDRAAQRRKKRHGYSSEEVDEILKNGGQLGMAQMLRCRVRYFTDGVAIGGREFVNQHIERLKETTSEFENRKTGATKMKGVPEGRLWSMRNLRVKPLGGSASE